ncbi:MAG: MBL fold metallo-hydrolase [Verrucomicrobia bacterium]|nr:MBL fold metallo-hydrolase [Verrucomicrobiota bacterium]
MTLEDHLGDILRKARLMKNVEPAAVAAAAGLNAEELAALEDSGQPPRPVNFAVLAPLLALDAAKLEGIARGWLPQPPALAGWRQLRQVTTARGMAVHCYLAWDEVTREAALFDTGFDPAPVFRLVEENRLNLTHLFITHSHHDHIEGLGAVRERFPKIRIHTDIKGAPPQNKNRRDDCIHVGRLRVTNRDTPGHAEDGVTYVIGNWPDDAPQVAIVGDAIFAGSMGGAKEHGELAKAKVREQILTLLDAALICPGHGPLTTVGQEKRGNPFF